MGERNLFKKLLSAKKLFLFGVFLIAVGIATAALSAPPGTPYSPGETLDPSCSPGDSNCTVTAPAVSGANSDITSLTGLTTALSVAQGGTGKNSMSSGKLLYGSASNTFGELAITDYFTIDSGNLKLSDNSIEEIKLKISNSPTNGYFLKYDNSNGMTWASVAGTTSGDFTGTFNGIIGDSSPDAGFFSYLKADNIYERSSASGVTIDSVLLKDGSVTGNLTGNVTGNVTGNLNGIVGGTTPAAGYFTNLTASGGSVNLNNYIILDGIVNLGKPGVLTNVNGSLSVDEAASFDQTMSALGIITAYAGITTGANIVSDTDSTDSLGNNITRFLNAYADTFTGNKIVLDGTTGINALQITDNVADALSVTHGGTDFMVLQTTDGSELLTIVPAVALNNTTQSASKDTGALVVEGGVGIEKNLYVGGNLNVAGTFTPTGTLNGNFTGNFDGIVGGNTPDAGIFTYIKADNIYEKTANAGVTADGVLLKDSAVNVDTINEKTGGSGVTIDSLLVKDGGMNGTVGAITPAAGYFTSLSSSGAVNLSDYVVISSNINLAKPGVLTNINGTLSVDEAAIFDTTVAVTGVLTTQAGITTGANIVSDTDSTDTLGTTGTRFLNAYSDTYTGNKIVLDGATGVNELNLTDNVADALSVTYNGMDFMVFDTREGQERLTIYPNTTINGNLTLNGTFSPNTLDIDGHSQFDRVTINTNDGNLQVIGTNQVDIDVATDISNTLVLSKPTGTALYVSLGNTGLGVNDPDEQLELTGRIHLNQSTAPGVTTDKLYNVGGNLYWNGSLVTGAVTNLQGAYNGSISPEMVLDATRGALTIRDASTPIGANLFEIQNNGGGTTYFSVSSSGAVVAGTLGVSGAATLSSTLDVDGGSTMDQVTVDTTDGKFYVTGSNFAHFGTETKFSDYLEIDAISAPGTTSNRLYNTGGSLYWNGVNITAGGTGTMQNSYNNSTSPELILDGTRGAFTIRDASSPIGANLFEIQSYNGSTSYLAIDTSGMTLNGAMDISSTLDVDGASTLDRLTVDTTDGNLQVIGSGTVDLDVAADIAGTLTLSKASGTALYISTGGNLGIGVSDPDEQIEITGRMHMGQTTAPGNVTDKLYNVSGDLYWNGTNISAGPSSALQAAYTNSGTKEIQLDNTRKGISIIDAASPISGSLFEIQNTDYTATYFSVDTSGVSVGGYLSVDDTFDVNGASTVDQLTVDTTDGNFQVTGSGSTDINTAADIADTLTLSKASGTALYISTGGNLGIGVSDPDEQIEITGRMHMGQTTAPGTTTDKLYNVSGNLYWNGSQVVTGTGGTSTLQDAYGNTSSEPEITLNGTRGAFTIRDNSSPIGANLFEIQNNGGGTTYFSVDSSGTVVAGNFDVDGATTLDKVTIDTTDGYFEIIGSSYLAVAVESKFSDYLQIDDISAPGTTTNRLYSVSGALYWNGTNISAGGGISNLQQAYDGGSGTEIVLTDADSTFTIQDKSGGIGTTLFEVASNGGGTIYFSVDANGVVVGGDLAVGGNVNVNSGKFTVNGTNGNTAVAGTLDVSGDTYIDADMTVTGAFRTAGTTVAYQSGTSTGSPVNLSANKATYVIYGSGYSDNFYVQLPDPTANSSGQTVNIYQYSDPGGSYKTILKVSNYMNDSGTTGAATIDLDNNGQGTTLMWIENNTGYSNGKWVKVGGTTGAVVVTP